jgi:hypothetical protein
MPAAFSTISRTAAGRRSAVLAEPLAWPKYTVTDKPTVAVVLDGIDLARAAPSRSGRAAGSHRPRPGSLRLVRACVSARATTSFSSLIREASTCCDMIYPSSAHQTGLIV